jgi:hypothetical protein
MAVITHVFIPGLTAEQYDRLRDVVGWLERPPAGGILHTAWKVDGGIRGTDAWESAEAFAAFGQDRLGPALAELGVAAEPEVTIESAHEVFAPNAVTII